MRQSCLAMQSIRTGEAGGAGWQGGSFRAGGRGAVGHGQAGKYLRTQGDMGTIMHLC